MFHHFELVGEVLIPGRGFAGIFHAAFHRGHGVRNRVGTEIREGIEAQKQEKEIGDEVRIDGQPDVLVPSLDKCGAELFNHAALLPGAGWDAPVKALVCSWSRLCASANDRSLRMVSAGTSFF